jgi:ribosomal protein S18 acetylase RimI-like enzyme
VCSRDHATSRHAGPEEEIMPFAARHRNDPTPQIAPLPGLVVRREEDAAAMAALQGRAEEEMRGRLADGHRAYVAWRDGEPAAWGWVATRTAEIGELGSAFAIPRGERYLWNFVTLPAHRGLGIYPRLLEAIVRAESREAERFWIAYAPENHASGAGIRKAGFVALAELSFGPDGAAAVWGLIPGAGRVGGARARAPRGRGAARAVLALRARGPGCDDGVRGRTLPLRLPAAPQRLRRLTAAPASERGRRPPRRPRHPPHTHTRSHGHAPRRPRRPAVNARVERVGTVVIGGGQAGLAAGHHLAARDLTS